MYLPGSTIWYCNRRSSAFSKCGASTVITTRSPVLGCFGAWETLIECSDIAGSLPKAMADKARQSQTEFMTPRCRMGIKLRMKPSLHQISWQDAIAQPVHPRSPTMQTLNLAPPARGSRQSSLGREHDSRVAGAPRFPAWSLPPRQIVCASARVANYLRARLPWIYGPAAVNLTRSSCISSTIRNTCFRLRQLAIATRPWAQNALNGNQRFSQSERLFVSSLC